jgi:hypothetical protein
MDIGNESEGAGGLDAFGRTAEFRAVVAVAEALREEFGVGIDAHPGGVGNEAGIVNRAFRAVARVILRAVVSEDDDLAAVVTWVLRQAALRRLADLGMEKGVVDRLLVMGPGLGDGWLAYLALAPEVVISDLIRFASESGC